MDLFNYEAQAVFRHQHLLTMMDYTPDEVLQVLSLALRLKAAQKIGQPQTYLAGKSVGMYFTKPSARTRISFEVGIHQLGGQPVLLDAASIGMGVRESISDVARVLSRYLDGMMIRTFAQAEVDALAEHASISIINGLTDDFHPCQSLADVMTVYEKFSTFKGVRMTYLGDGNNVAHSLLLCCACVGMDLTVATPQSCPPRADIVSRAQELAKQTGSRIEIVNDPRAAAQGAHVLYTDVWSSMGQESQKQTKDKLFEGFQINAAMMSLADKDAIFMHCLPAHRGEEVTDEIMDGRQSVVFDQAENRLHAQKGIMALTMGNPGRQPHDLF